VEARTRWGDKPWQPQPLGEAAQQHFHLLGDWELSCDGRSHVFQQSGCVSGVLVASRDPESSKICTFKWVICRILVPEVALWKGDVGEMQMLGSPTGGETTGEGITAEEKPRKTSR